MSFRTACSYLALLVCAACLGAQDFSLTDLNLETAGRMKTADHDYPVFGTSGNMAGRFVPVEQLQFRAGVSFSTDNTVAFLHPAQTRNTPGTVTFDGASITSPSVLDGPLNISVFTGKYENPASGSLLKELLKTELSSPEFLDMPAGKAFTTDTDIRGTGLAMTAVPRNRNVAVGTYAYWNAETGRSAFYTFDLQLAQTNDLIRFNSFAGLAISPGASKPSVRGGFSSIIVSPSGNEIYTEAGVRTTEAGSGEFTDNLYFLLEPRMIFEHADIAFTFFSVPVTVSATTGEKSRYLGSNILAGFGNLNLSGIRGGISLLACIDPERTATTTPFTFSASPFCDIKIGDCVLNATLMINPLEFRDRESMGEIQISLKAVL